MKSFIKYLFVLCSFCLAENLLAQQSIMDSLLTVLKTAKEDTNKVNLLYQLSEECGAQEDILIYAQQSLSLAEKLRYKKGIANALNNVGFVYDNQG